MCRAYQWWRHEKHRKPLLHIEQVDRFGVFDVVMLSNVRFEIRSRKTNEICRKIGKRLNEYRFFFQSLKRTIYRDTTRFYRYRRRINGIPAFAPRTNIIAKIFYRFSNFPLRDGRQTENIKIYRYDVVFQWQCTGQMDLINRYFGDRFMGGKSEWKEKSSYSEDTSSRELGEHEQLIMVSSSTLHLSFQWTSPKFIVVHKLPCNVYINSKETVVEDLNGSVEFKRITGVFRT